MYLSILLAYQWSYLRQWGNSSHKVFVTTVDFSYELLLLLLLLFQFHYQLPYGNIFGGAEMFTREDYKKVYGIFLSYRITMLVQKWKKCPTIVRVSATSPVIVRDIKF